MSPTDMRSVTVPALVENVPTRRSSRRIPCAAPPYVHDLRR